MQDYKKAIRNQTVITVISGTAAIIFMLFSVHYLSLYLSVLLAMLIAMVPIGVYFIFGKHVFYFSSNTSKKERLKMGLICFFSPPVFVLLRWLFNIWQAGVNE